MKVDNPQAFAYIMQEEIYLLNKDKSLFTAAAVAEPKTAEVSPIAEQIVPASAIVAEQPTAPVTPALNASNAPKTEIQTADNEFNYLGKNNKNFVVLVNYADHEHIHPVHLTALQSILQRKGLALDDVAILNVNQYNPVKLTTLATYFAPTRLVIMGADALPDGIGKLPLNKPLQGKKTHVLYSFSFDEMMSSNDNKKLFWEHMKTL